MYVHKTSKREYTVKSFRATLFHPPPSPPLPPTLPVGGRGGRGERTRQNLAFPLSSDGRENLNNINFASFCLSRRSVYKLEKKKQFEGKNLVYIFLVRL